MHGLVIGLIAFSGFSSLFVSKTFPFQLENSATIAGLSLPSLGVSPSEEPVLMSGVLTNTIGRDEFDDALVALSGEGEPPAQAEAVVEATATSVPPPPPLYTTYAVQPGDTAASIAERFGVTLQYLLWNNPELRDGNVLGVGDTLFIPAGNGILYYVSLGETLSGIASVYGTSVDEIVGWPGNGLLSADQVVEGELVFIPGGVPPVIATPVPPPTPTPAPVHVDAPTSPAPAPPPPPPPPPPAATTGLIWPFSGRISTYFGGGHAGIDIDGFGQEGASVVSATSGTVIRVAGDACCAYGLYVDVQSPSGLVTRYAHLASFAVSLGQSVSQGQSVGIVGRTGNATGTHLHFEVRVNGVPQDPLAYLP